MRRIDFDCLENKADYLWAKIHTYLNKTEKYKELLTSCRAIVEGEKDTIANLANVCALIKEKFSFFWVGFYIVKNDQLVLGPFQGPVACTRINFGKGVCGTSWEKNEAILVPDVHEFPGHIACSEHSKSELVVPISKNGEVQMVLDIDSDVLNDFDQDDLDGMNELCRILEDLI